GRVGLGVAVRPPWGANTPWRFEPALTGALRLGPLELAAWAGLTWPAKRAIPMPMGTGTLTFRAFPARLAIGWGLALGEGRCLVPTAAAGVDVVLAETRGIGMTRRSSSVEPVLEGGVALRAAVTRHIWIDVQAFQGLDLRPEEFYVTDPATSRSLTLL